MHAMVPLNTVPDGYGSVCWDQSFGSWEASPRLNCPPKSLGSPKPRIPFCTDLSQYPGSSRWRQPVLQDWYPFRMLSIFWWTTSARNQMLSQFLYLKLAPFCSPSMINDCLTNVHLLTWPQHSVSCNHIQPNDLDSGFNISTSRLHYAPATNCRWWERQRNASFNWKREPDQRHFHRKIFSWVGALIPNVQ